jgi:hypothetical protein
MPLKAGRRIHPLSMPLQVAAMREWFPQFHCQGSNKHVIWTGNLRRNSEAPEYTVRLEYVFRFSPKVYVISPEIIEDAPHTYRADNRLCLHHPCDLDWSAEKLIACTIMPWTVEWLRFYEIWLVTGEWFGPEAPHSGEK